MLFIVFFFRCVFRNVLIISWGLLVFLVFSVSGLGILIMVFVMCVLFFRVFSSLNK